MSISSSPGCALANVSTTEFLRLFVDKCIKHDLIDFYHGYVDDSLVLVNENDIDNIIKQSNYIDKIIQCTIYRSEDGIVHFLDTKIIDCATDLYYKTTDTGQNCDFSKQTL